ncbi:MAG: hypothetical protein IJ292_01435 [Clostridia bacterium]|nr:hypothetical protein [Clostridia bacterium]
MKIYLIKKLTSRKFWLAIIGFITPLLISFGVTESAATQIAGIIMSGAACIAYIVGEGLVDAEQAYNKNYDSTNDTP